QRNICCHTGGSIAFDKDGNLFLSTGDNSTPFNQQGSKYTLNGYAPVDSREGNKQWDARRSSGNSNDLRGKILRIKVAEDGTYTVPEGNLYPKGTEGTRPEIYAQGLRNPYRISVDQKNGYLYWGEVGPDANNDSLATKGSRGYDEVNQARKAGHFGWPYIIGNNFAYTEFNYETGQPGPSFDPAGPINNSPNNTGLKKLPAVEPAFIWYPYAASPDFPQLGTGGRNAMAGPLYYSDMYPSETRMPDYYNSKLFIYDWIRGWIKVVSMQENGDFDKMEPFMPGTKFNALIDMEMGPDGKIYILEYGNGWFAKNPDAGLFRIDYNGGNRPPVVTEVKVDKTSGKSPLQVTFTATASDPENDAITYTWDLGAGVTKTTKEPTLTHSFTATGEFEIQVTAADAAGLTGKGPLVAVYSGNVAPQVSISVVGNQSFYFPGKKVNYTIAVSDEDHPEAASDMSSLYVAADYLQGIDQAEADMGHKIMSEAMTGKSLLQSLTCKTCHNENEKSIGPAYADVAKKYRESDRDYLVKKIKNGGAGVWGEKAMPAYPDLKNSELNSLVTYILFLGQESKPNLGAAGSLDPTLGKPASPTGSLVISASYSDQGGTNIKPLTGSSSLVLSPNTINLEQAGGFSGYAKMVFDGKTFLTVPNTKGSFSLTALDVTGIGSVTLMTASQEPIKVPVDFEIRLDSPSGAIVGKGTHAPSQGMKLPNMPILMHQAKLTLTSPGDGKKHTLYFVSDAKGADLGTFIIMGITFNAK
ncbi:MAG: PQQ-dependent sugar dehydrogenase, partial [Bacteroidetes bacterium]|nr:PQQ-dependent sugar dehydrogenase [Bacteroidota bacterium]